MFEEKKRVRRRFQTHSLLADESIKINNKSLTGVNNRIRHKFDESIRIEYKELADIIQNKMYYNFNIDVKKKKKRDDEYRMLTFESSWNKLKGYVTPLKKQCTLKNGVVELCLVVKKELTCFLKTLTLLKTVKWNKMIKAVFTGTGSLYPDIVSPMIKEINEERKIVEDEIKRS